MADRIVPLIICGGAGTRLWPLSRDGYPKQFIPLFGERSTFQDTMLRVADDRVFDRPVIIMGARDLPIAERQLAGIELAADIVLEPAGRDSGPAIAAGATFVQRCRDHSGLVLALAADHVVKDVPAFVAGCENARDAAGRGYIVTFGVEPEHPATEYGYIAPGPAIGGHVRRVLSFVEKPDAATAARYAADGYLWNSGNFLFQVDRLLDEYRAVDPISIGAITDAVLQARRAPPVTYLNRAAFERATPRSLDYAVMERTTRAAVVPVSLGWSDVGSWRAVWDLSPKDKDGNAARGGAIFESARNCLVWTDKTPVALDSVEDIAIVATADSILVSRQSGASGLKRLVAKLKRSMPDLLVAHQRKQETDATTSMQLIDAGDAYRVLRLVVEPSAAFSRTEEPGRSECWIVVSGRVIVTSGGAIRILHPSESIRIPAGLTYRINNPAEYAAVLIKVESGYANRGDDDPSAFPVT